MDKQIEIRPYSSKELAAMYGVSSRTFRRWMLLIDKHAGKRIGNYYIIPQVKIIFEKLGVPHVYEF
jgi:hypothetical protein